MIESTDDPDDGLYKRLRDALEKQKNLTNGKRPIINVRNDRNANMRRIANVSFSHKSDNGVELFLEIKILHSDVPAWCLPARSYYFMFEWEMDISPWEVSYNDLLGAASHVKDRVDRLIFKYRERKLKVSFILNNNYELPELAALDTIDILWSFLETISQIHDFLQQTETAIEQSIAEKSNYREYAVVLCHDHTADIGQYSVKPIHLNLQHSNIGED